MRDEIAAAVWNQAIGVDSYAEEKEKYQQAVMEQYKLYVEAVDRVTQRRGATLAFFLTLNAGVFTVIGAIARARDVDPLALLSLALLVGLTQSAIWYGVTRNYHSSSRRST